MDISDLIVRKINDRLSSEEEAYFNHWLNESPNNRLLYDYLKNLNKENIDTSSIHNLDVDKAWQMVFSKVRDRKDNLRRLYVQKFLKYAAVFIGLIMIGLVFKNQLKVDKSLNSNTESITLTLEDGNFKVISKEGKDSIYDNKGNLIGLKEGDQITYLNSNQSTELIYNTIKIPYGKTFKVRLSDGTIVHLNAGSSLKFPMNFIDGLDREVTLTGEGFFMVQENKNDPFIVHTSQIKIRVYGTSFNINSYSEDAEISTVLVEGSVGIFAEDLRNNKEPIYLKPGEKGVWEKNENQLEVEKVNTNQYTEWINGKLIIKSLSFKEITKKLERQYNVQIKNNYDLLEKQTFTATFDVESIEEVLNSFKTHTPFNYEINNNIITINKP